MRWWMTAHHARGQGSGWAANTASASSRSRSSPAPAHVALPEIGQAHAILVLASGTRPMARWRHQNPTDKPRDQTIAA